MKLNTLLLLFTMLSTITSIVAQEKENSLLNTAKSEMIISLKNSVTQREQSILNNQQYTTVTQIGNDNTILSNISTTNTANAQYVQYGDQNNIDILSTNKEVNQTIYQVGDQNTYSHYNYNSFENQNLNVIQNGNKQNIEVFGENSISKDMIIKMEGSDKSLIIRSFN